MVLSGNAIAIAPPAVDTNHTDFPLSSERPSTTFQVFKALGVEVGDVPKASLKSSKKVALSILPFNICIPFDVA